MRIMRNNTNAGKSRVKIITAIIIFVVILSIIALMIINQRVSTFNTASLKVEKQDEEIKAAVDTRISGGIKWSIDANGKLYVVPVQGSETPASGYSVGQMPDFNETPPWYQYKNQIKTVQIGNSDAQVTVKSGNSLQNMFNRVYKFN